ncbi:hypothetical protein HRD49_41685 [Corallococcus exiguus]|uniref:hypothetical protein n=1 Tax=Corallococcus TaxID=83461 RepID=UPI000EA323BD|nr:MULTISPECIES: hypothetical protein [Corallococcus]NNC21515.1 hypothetical protein [Corallococcus exiguus]NRD68257.1 hypothetical protein [Corallococcus exiguus]RKH16819.1 hypothetical protein D7V77_36675 [Corallococcus sp. CA041A]
MPGSHAVPSRATATRLATSRGPRVRADVRDRNTDSSFGPAVRDWVYGEHPLRRSRAQSAAVVLPS